MSLHINRKSYWKRCRGGVFPPVLPNAIEQGELTRNMWHDGLDMVSAIASTYSTIHVNDDYETNIQTHLAPP